MRKIRIALVVAVAMFALSLSATNITFQMSTSNFYTTGYNTFGTSTTCVGLNCPIPSTMGDTSGTELFSISSQVSFDGHNTTYSYWLTNDNIAAPATLSGLVIGSQIGQLITGATSPTGEGWVNIPQPSAWSWLCNGCGVAQGQTAPTSPDPSFSVTINGLVLPQLEPVVVGVSGIPGEQGTIFISGIDANTTGPDNWQVSGDGSTVIPTPEPASLVLLASGLLGGGFFTRRRK